MVLMTTTDADAGTAANDAVPHVLDRGAHGLAPGALRYENTKTLILAAVLTPLAVAACFLIPDTTWRFWALVAIGVLTAATVFVDIPFVNRWEIQNTTYTVNSDVVFIRRGLLMQRTTTLSTAQILTVEVAQGPLLRAFKLVRVRFVCIADVEALTGLSAEAAEVIRETILQSQNGHDDD